MSGLKAYRHIGDLVGDYLVLDDRLAKGLPLLCIRKRKIETALQKAQSKGGNHRAGAVEPLHGDSEPVTFVSDQRAFGYNNII